MISEKEFANSHVAFWRQLLPMSEEYIRSRNRQLGRFSTPLRSELSPHTRGAVNELGFRLFAKSVVDRVAVEALPHEAILACVDATLAYVFPNLEERTADALGRPEVLEASSLASRLLRFFDKGGQRSLVPFPVFRGCGWIDECVGDVLAEEGLFEIKAGGRNFRIGDVRQVLIYCALDFASQEYDVRRVCLVNPRVGVFLNESVDDLCGELAGRPAVDVLTDIVQFVSEPQDLAP